MGGSSAGKRQEMSEKWGSKFLETAEDWNSSARRGRWLGWGDNPLNTLDKEMQEQKVGWARDWRKKYGAVGKKGLLTGMETGREPQQNEGL